MKLSIIVPIYNVEDYLKDCLDSIVRNIVPDVEVILIDDGSKDGSKNICEFFCEKYDFFSYYYKENGGLSDARNCGLKYAKAKYVFFLDSDDLMEDNSLQEIVDKLDDCDALVFDMKFKWFETLQTMNLKGFDNRYKDNVKSFLLSSPSACNKIIKKDILEKFLFPKNMYYEDLATIPKIYPFLKSVVYIEKPFYIYRQRKGSIIYTFSPKILDIFKVLDGIFEYYKENNLFETYYEELEYLCIESLMLQSNRRFLHYEKENYLKLSKEYIKKHFKNWKNNKYYKKMNFNDRLFIYVSSFANKKLLNSIIKIKNVIKKR